MTKKYTLYYLQGPEVDAELICVLFMCLLFLLFFYLSVTPKRSYFCGFISGALMHELSNDGALADSSNFTWKNDPASHGSQCPEWGANATWSCLQTMMLLIGMKSIHHRWEKNIHKVCTVVYFLSLKSPQIFLFIVYID